MRVSLSKEWLLSHRQNVSSDESTFKGVKHYQCSTAHFFWSPRILSILSGTENFLSLLIARY